MIALDTNLLIYAHRTAVPEHKAAQQAIQQACNATGGCGISMPCIAEFWSIVTHPAATGRPSSSREASAFIRALVETGSIEVWTPGFGFADRLMQLAEDLDVSGVRIFDLQIALVAFEHGAHEIWTHDRSFVRLPGMKICDPLGVN